MHLRSEKRWLAALVAISYLLGYLLAFAHFAGEQHEVCLEHGESHHAEASHDLESSDAVQAEPALAALPAIDHDHCDLLHAVMKPVMTQVRASVSALEVPAAIDIHPTYYDLPPPVGLATWRYAPKQSPPSHV